jgi:hypothetical protein
MGHIGLGLLIVSGLYLITPYWKMLGSMPLLIAKLVLVVALTTLIGMITIRSKQAKTGNAAEQMEKNGNIRQNAPADWYHNYHSGSACAPLDFRRLPYNKREIASRLPLPRRTQH